MESTPQTRLVNGFTHVANGSLEEQTSRLAPILSLQVTSILALIFGTFIGVLTGLVGMLTNAANISVYLRMGLTETTNISFFALSIFDLFVSMSTVVVLISYSRLVSGMRLPSGAAVGEIGVGACFILYPCLGCSAWITAILSTERCLCIAMPLKVRQIVTPRRTVLLIIVMVVYQAVFAVLNFGFTGPPYDKPSPRRFLYYICSFSAPSGICFGIVVVSTTVLVIRLKRNLEWRNEATKTYPGGTGNTKERKAARSVIAICTIFIVCFVPNVTNLVVSNVFPQFDPRDPYWGNLSRIVFILSFVFQVVNSSVNIVVYYSMGTKYREVFKDLFFKKAN